jgi:hypothetical protein
MLQKVFTFVAEKTKNHMAQRFSYSGLHFHHHHDE